MQLKKCFLIKTVLCFFVLLCLFQSSSFSVSAQDNKQNLQLIGGLERRAKLNFSFKVLPSGAAQITKIDSLSNLIKQEIEVGDIITQVNDISLNQKSKTNDILYGIKGKKAIAMIILRNQEILKKEVIFETQSLESYKNNTIYYNYVATEYGDKLRTITTIPKQKKEKYPAVLLVQWLSCSSIENNRKPYYGYDYILDYFANSSQMAFMRVEKPSVGDSEGIACSECDLDRELEGYKKALAALKQNPNVDTTQIYILGLSLGTSLAPLVGENQNIKGYIVSGGCTVTWLEHMIELERRRLSLIGESYPQINQKMKGYIPFYQKYYVEKKFPYEIINQYPQFSELWYEEDAHQYGRPAKFYHQVQEQNFEEAWSKVKSPTLVLYGEYDWIMSKNDHEKITYLVNQNKSNTAQFFIIPKAGHLLSTYSSPKDAFNWKNPKKSENLIPIIDKWIEVQLQN